MRTGKEVVVHFRNAFRCRSANSLRPPTQTSCGDDLRSRGERHALAPCQFLDERRRGGKGSELIDTVVIDTVTPWWTAHMAKESLSRYALAPWGMQPNTSCDESLVLYHLSSDSAYYTIFVNPAVTGVAECPPRRRTRVHAGQGRSPSSAHSPASPPF